MSLQAQWVNQLKKELKTDSFSEFQSEIEGLSWDFSDNNKHLPNFDFSSKYNTPCVFFSYYNVVNEKHSNTEILKVIRALGSKITKSRLPKYLSDPFYCGWIANKHLNGRVVKGLHEPLISKEMFLKIIKMIFLLNIQIYRV